MTRATKNSLTHAACILGLASLLALASQANAQTAPAGPAMSWTTLGTSAGPIARPDRSQPANLLKFGDQFVLVDVGDGAPEQLAKAGVPVQKIQTLIISHHHFDHIGGLFALLSMRYQVIAPNPLTIYGPPGTAALIKQLNAAIVTAASNLNINARATWTPDEGVKVVEIGDGASFTIGNVAVRAIENTHYLPTTPVEGKKPLSLSFRFDGPGGSVGYTGDTGPSPKLASFFKEVGLLVCEIVDPESALPLLRKMRPDLPAAAFAEQEMHMRKEHLPTQDVGELAARAKVGKLVVTHIAVPEKALEDVKKKLAALYTGPIAIAKDLDTF